MSRFFWSTATEREREFLLRQQCHQLLEFQVLWNQNKLLEDCDGNFDVHPIIADAGEYNNMPVDDYDSESSDDSLSLSSFTSDDSSTSEESSLTSVGTDEELSSLASSSSSSSSDDGSLIDAAVSNAIDKWLEVYGRVHLPIEVPGVVWGRRLLVDDLTEAEAVLHFRFRKPDLQLVVDQLWGRLAPFLQGPRDNIQVKGRYTTPYETGMLLLIYRMAHTTRVRPEMELFFGMRHCHIGCVLDSFSHALCSLALTYLSNPLLLSSRFGLYAAKIHSKCGLLDRVWGFIDGTIRQTCRPSYFQKRTYSGHKRYHGLKFQSVVTPDGFFGHFFGPTNGNRHDSFMLGESGLLPTLGNYMAAFHQPYVLYGDPAYPQSGILFGGFRNPPEGSDMAAFNTAMSKVRESVEWGFATIIRSWPFLGHKTSMKLFKIPVARYYILGAFLCNIRNCLYPNQVAIYFKCKPVALDEYLNFGDAAE